MDRPLCIISRPIWRGGVTVQTGLEARTAVGLLLAVALLTLIGWLYLDQTATITATRAEIRALRHEKDDLRMQARYLQAKIAEQSSVDRVMRLAQQADLRPPGDTTTLVVQPLAAPMYPTAGLAHAGAEETTWWLQAVQGTEQWIAGLAGTQR